MQLHYAFLPLVLSLIFLLSWVAPKEQNRQRESEIPAIYVIGDSTADSGVNNYIPTLVKSNFPPYGCDFEGRKPTGRFSNGKLITDFVVSEMGIKELLPPWLNPDLDPRELLTGISFASAGTGYDNFTAQIQSVVPIWKQLEWLRVCMKRIREEVGEEEAEKLTANSIYALSLGSNDVILRYVNPLHNEWNDLSRYSSFLVGAAVDVTKELHKLGARKIAVIGLPPLGSLPLLRFISGATQRDSNQLNAHAMAFNTYLSKELNSLREEYPRSKIIYIDIYTKLLDIISHPTAYGFEEGKFGCCGMGLSFLCNGVSLVCSNTSKYVFWDAVHPTERANKIVAMDLVKNYILMFN